VEENLTFDGSTLGVTGNVNVSGQVSGATGVFTAVTVNGQPTTYGVVNPDYISVGNNGAAQNVAASGTDIIFDTNISSSGIGYSTSTGVFTLTAGKTYRITSEIAFQNYSTDGYVLVQLVDGSSNTQINTQTNTYPYNSGFNEVNNLVSDIIYTPNTNQTVKFRVTGGTTGITAQQRGAGFSRAVIQQINPTIAVQATATGTLNATVGNVTLSSSYSQVVAATIPGTTIFTLPTLQPGTYLITAQAKVNGGYSAMGIFTGGSQVANTSVFSWYQASGTVNNGLQGTWVLTVTTPTVYTINAWGGGTVSAGSDGAAVANYIQINPTFSLTAINGLTTTGDVSIGGTASVNGNLGVTGSASIGGNLTVTGGIRKSSRILTTTTTLTVADAGSFIQFNGGPYTVTLPNPTLAANSGIGYRFWLNTVSNITLSTPSGSFFGPSGSSTSTVVLVQATTSYWDVWSDGFNWILFAIKIAP
jgi:hypothetical protein